MHDFAQVCSLTWDTQHKANRQQVYCYCGGPGNCYLKMIQCCDCRQWFHEACLQCLKHPLLYGDRFYVFICSVCNAGPEYIRRLDLTWLDIVHLALFNLSLQHKKTYFDIDTVLFGFIESIWELMQVTGEIARTSTKDRRTIVLSTLQSNQTKFKCGREMKKKTTLWGLRSRVPPFIPKYDKPTICLQKSPKQEAQKMYSSFRPLPNVSQKKILKRKKLDKPKEDCQLLYQSLQSSLLTPPPEDSALQDNSTKTTKQKSKLLPNSAKQVKYGLTSDDKNSNVNTNSVQFPRTTHKFAPGKNVTRIDPIVSFKRTLDSIIPPPSNFEGHNNPFSHLHGSLSHSVKYHVSELDNHDCSPYSEAKCRRPPGRQPAVVGDRFAINGKKTLPRCCKTMNGNNLPHNRQEIYPLGNDKPLGSGFSIIHRSGAGERIKVVARRVSQDGKLQHLIEWPGILA